MGNVLNETKSKLKGLKAFNELIQIEIDTIKESFQSVSKDFSAILSDTWPTNIHNVPFVVPDLSMEETWPVNVPIHNYQEMKRKMNNIVQRIERLESSTSYSLINYKKKIQRAIAKMAISEADQLKLLDYYDAFLQTFASIYIVSLALDNDNEISIKTENEILNAVTFAISFAPLVVEKLARIIEALTSFIIDKKTIKKARIIRCLASDAVELNQLIGEVLLKVLMDTGKQSQLLKPSKEVVERTRTTFAKIVDTV